ncbi:MAG: glycosyltransferase family 2 protein [Mitsuaria chitosanitabida]|nr:glycosyltransferase family 2 protein [Roseateles chitosanitabidus]
MLTICIPTYNRADCLEMLLDALRVELGTLQGLVRVVIGDNASTDRTPEVTRAFAAAMPDALVLRHERNLGPDENFCRCIAEVATEHFWIIGDDDLPRPGLIAAMLPMLERAAPDLLYINSKDMGDVTEADREALSPGSLDAASLDRRAFASLIHVGMTFVSGCVIRRRFAPNDGLRRFTGTHLVQLGWVFEALAQGQRFVHVRTPAVFATAGNRGSYAVLRVFGDSFQRIAREVFVADKASRRIGELIVSRTSIYFLPSVVWALRQATLGDFDRSERAAAAMQSQLGGSLIYRLLVLPLESLPTLPARALMALNGIIGRFVSLYDRANARLRGALRPL